MLALLLAGGLTACGGGADTDTPTVTVSATSPLAESMATQTPEPPDSPKAEPEPAAEPNPAPTPAIDNVTTDIADMGSVDSNRVYYHGGPANLTPEEEEVAQRYLAYWAMAAKAFNNPAAGTGEVGSAATGRSFSRASEVVAEYAETGQRVVGGLEITVNSVSLLDRSAIVCATLFDRSVLVDATGQAVTVQDTEPTNQRSTLTNPQLGDQIWRVTQGEPVDSC